MTPAEAADKLRHYLQREPMLARIEVEIDRIVLWWHRVPAHIGNVTSEPFEGVRVVSRVVEIKR